MSTETMHPNAAGGGITAAPASPEQYNYDHFHPKYFAEDAKLAVKPRGVVPGDVAPDFELRDTEGRSLRLSELRGKPVVLITGSATCPLTHGPTLYRALDRLFQQGGRGAIADADDSVPHMLGPLTFGWDGIERGGEVSTHDIWKGAPPMAANLWLGNHMKPLLAPLASRGKPVPTGVKLAAGALALGFLLSQRKSKRQRGRLRDASHRRSELGWYDGSRY